MSSNGATKHTKVIAKAPEGKKCCCGNKGLSMKEKFEKIMADLNVCSQRGLSDRFDSTIGAGTVVMPYGGKTPADPIPGDGCQDPRPARRDQHLLGDGLGL